MKMEHDIRTLTHGDETERIYAAQDLGDTGSPQAAAALVRRLPHEPSQAVRDAIVFALKTLPGVGIIEDIRLLFHSPDPYLRNAAIDIIGAQGGAAVPALTRQIDSEDPEVRKLILDALFATGAPEAVAAIRSRLDDPAINVRITAVEYLGRLEDHQSLDAIIPIFYSGTEPMLRMAALNTLAALSTTIETAQKVLDGLPPAHDLARHHPTLRPQIIRLVAQAGDPDRLARTIEAIDPPDPYDEDIVHAIESVGDSLPVLSGHPAIRRIIADIEAGSPDPTLRALCRTLLSDGADHS